METQILEYFSQFDFDVRKTGNARFMDQKCTPDVVCAVAECILEYIGDDLSIEFTKNDIWHSDYASELISESFSKPDLSEESMDSEYDKFFAQPLKALSYAKILEEDKRRNTNHYKVKNREILEYISLRERNALNFLDMYLTKTMVESDLYIYFENFFVSQNKDTFNILRSKLADFILKFTSIDKPLEPPRIYNKIINVLAFKRKKKGGIRGHLSKNILTIDEIRYNRLNWRDINKDKTMSRQAYAELFNQNLNGESGEGYYKYAVQKAKKFVKQLHPFSEIHRFEEYPGLQAHHIFMESEYPEIADFPENIICITPNQHYLRAHPDNKTSIIDKDYQIICLLSKLDSIEMNYRSGGTDYALSDFVRVLNIGFDTETFTPQMDYEEVKYQIMKNAYYQGYL